MMEFLRQKKIVIIESDRWRRDHYRSMISDWGHLPFAFESASICLDNLVPLEPDLVISGGLASDATCYFVDSVKRIRYDLPVLIFSEDSEVQEYINTKGFADIRLVELAAPPKEIKNAVQQTLNFAADSAEGHNPLIIGNTTQILFIKKIIPEIGRSNEVVLINGEPGTGKELFGRAIHALSERKIRPFVKINAVKLPYQLLESQFFGDRERGFANRSDRLKWRLADADKSTLFIKEINAMPQSLQARMLSLFEDGFQRFDNSAADAGKKHLDIRIIASTSADLTKLVANGSFRSDLFYRLNVLNLSIPPLRKRAADIPSLTDCFAEKYCREYNLSYFQISAGTKSNFCAYRWPGNVKQLEEAVKQIVLCGSEESVVNFMHMNSDKNLRRMDDRRCAPDLNSPGMELYLRQSQDYSLKSIRRHFTAETEKCLIINALIHTNWNRKKASELLEISYKSLLTKMKSFRIR